MQLPEVDAFDAEPPYAEYCLLLEVFGTAKWNPYSRAGPRKTGLGRDDDAVIGMERFADQALADFGAVAVSGVDEIDAEFG